MRTAVKGGRLASVAVAVLVGWVEVGAQLPSESRLNLVRASVVRVDARQCTGSNTAATGFVWGNRSQVVTTLHAVAGCGNLSVYYESQKTSRAATLSHVLSRADLALLDIQNPVNVPPLERAPRPPALYDQVVALGYHLNVPSIAGTTLTLRYGGKVLRDIVPPSVGLQLQSVGSPSVDLDVVNFEGHLLPGLSGAPILNADGRIVAIADGGLENGAASSSWGLPVHYLDSLGTSTDKVPSMPQRLRTLFAADIDTAIGKHVTCGQAELVQLRRRRLLDLASSADDQLGLAQLSMVLGFQQAEFQFDIYQHLQSGATIVVPADITLQTVSGMCTGRSAGGRIEMRIKLMTVSSPLEVQQASVQYENDIARRDGGVWQIDPSFSYLGPLSRFDGLLVRRKAAMRYGAGTLGVTSQKYLFETLAARGNMLIGTSVINHDVSPQTLQSEAACASGVQLPVCASLVAARRQWAQMVLAVQMTTFPVG